MVMDGADFQFLTENSADVICRISAAFVLYYVSPSSLPVLGWRPEELVGKGPSAYVIPEDMPLLLEIVKRNRAPGRAGHAGNGAGQEEGWVTDMDRD